MSNNSGSRKSMDDVLSSIRRIVGSDKRGAEASDDAPMPLGAPLPLGEPLASGEPLSLGEPMSGDEPLKLGMPIGNTPADPLSLTPNMRMDFAKLNDVEPARRPPMRAETPPPPPAFDDEDGLMIDEAALEDMIRRIVREELAAERDEMADAEERMRGLVREELMGELGQNISHNVKRLVASEVERLLADRDD